MLKNRNEYEQAKAEVEALLDKGTKAGGFEKLDIEDIKRFKELALRMEKYENEAMKIYPFEGKNPLLVRLEEEMFARRMSQRDFAKLLEISDSRLSDVIRGKASISIKLAKRLHSLLKIDGNLILENI